MGRPESVCPSTLTDYMFTTKTGTSMSTFREYIRTLPDQGEGYQIVYELTPWQSYLTQLTPEEAEEVARQPFVNFITTIHESGDPF